MKKYRKIVSLLTAAAIAALSPMQVLAENPEFAHDAATWERLRDNVMEYDELQMLVEEYNPNYMNNQVAYKDTKSDDDSETLRQEMVENADEMYSMAEDYRDKADSLASIADALQGLNKEQSKLYLNQVGVNSVSSLMSAYTATLSGAAMMESRATSQQISSDSSYVDSEMRKIQYLKNQTGLIASTQSVFSAYNQLKNSVAVIEKNIELMDALYAATELKAATNMATQADVLTAKKNVQSLQSSYTQAQSSLNSTRQKLCLMTGWSYDAQPDIQSVPAVDLNRILLMNPETDKQQALANNYDLMYNKRQYSNMQTNTTDQRNMERTIKNMEDNIGASLNNLYSDVLQKKTSYELAEAALATETTKMNAVELKYQIGSASRLEYIQEQAELLGKQVDKQTAETALFQSMETYDWAVKGYMNLQ